MNLSDRTAECPFCNIAMAEVIVRATTGYMLLLDQCSTCGGVWCDQFELFPILPSEADRIDVIDVNKLTESAAGQRTEPSQCPRCPVMLKEFRDPLLPTEAGVLRCPLCEGIWLGRGKLRRMKRARQKEPIPAAAGVEDLVRIYQDRTPATWATVRNIDAALHPAPIDDEAEIRTELEKSAFSIGLQILIRLLFRV